MPGLMVISGRLVRYAEKSLAVTNGAISTVFLLSFLTGRDEGEESVRVAPSRVAALETGEKEKGMAAPTHSHLE